MGGGRAVERQESDGEEAIEGMEKEEERRALHKNHFS